MIVALVGLPGSGKTTVGRQLARRKQLAFVDSDQVIEQRLGYSIREHFEREGEDSFRAFEQAVVDDLTQSFSGVLSTGGGVVLRPVNCERLRSRTTVVYLHSLPEEVFRRLRQDTNRPLLQVSDPLAQLKNLYAIRDPLYRATASIIIETGRPSVAALVSLLTDQLEQMGFFGGRVR